MKIKFTIKGSMSSVKGIVVRVCESQVAVKYYKAMLHTSAQHSAQFILTAFMQF